MGSIVMQVVNSQIISGKKVLLRYDIDVALRLSASWRIAQGKPADGREMVVAEDFKLKAGLDTLRLCLENAAKVIMIGHIGRPSFAEATEGKPDKFFVPKYSVAPIVEWFAQANYQQNEKFTILENLRFDPRESFDTAQDKEAVMQYAKELARLGDIFVNEAFAAHHPSASTTVIPTILPHLAGLRFAAEVQQLSRVRKNPKKPLIAIIGGVKIEDKLPAVEALSKIADAVLVGGKIALEWTKHDAIVHLNENILPGKLNDQGSDLAEETTLSWQRLISGAKMIVWNGPLGMVEDEKNHQTAKVAQMVINSGAETIVGGGDTIAYLNRLGLLAKFSFVSTGGGAMLKFLTDGTLPTIEVLD